jgi:hypothetical protein
MPVSWSLLHAFWTNRISYIGVRVMRTFVTVCQFAVKKGKFASSVACTTMIPSRIWIDSQTTFGAPIPSPPFCRHPSLGLSGTYALAHDDGWIPRGQRKMSRSFRPRPTYRTNGTHCSRQCVGQIRSEPETNATRTPSSLPMVTGSR